MVPIQPTRALHIPVSKDKEMCEPGSLRPSIPVNKSRTGQRRNSVSIPSRCKFKSHPKSAERRRRLFNGYRGLRPTENFRCCKLTTYLRLVPRFRVRNEGWNFNFGNAAVISDTAHVQSSYFHRPSMYSSKLC